MKKIMCLLTSLVLVLSVGFMSVSAEEASTAVFVTITDKDGNPVLIREEIAVSDLDNDGIITIDEALFAIHEAKFEGGAAAGYASSDGDYGRQLDKLWGNANGGAYGYFVNNEMAMGLDDEVKDGDFVYAYTFTDLDFWSDTYSYFDVNQISAKQGDEVVLTLNKIGFDDNFCPVGQPAENAEITFDGVATGFKTDAEGKVTVKLDKTGEFLISAKSESDNLVPAIIKASVEKTAVEDDNSSDIQTPEKTEDTKAQATVVSTPAKTENKAAKSPKTGDNSAVLFVLTAVCGIISLSALKKLYEI